MRKLILTGIASLGLLAIGAAVMPHSTSVHLANADGGSTDVRMNSRDLVAMIDTNRSRPMLVADAQASGADTRRMQVAIG